MKLPPEVKELFKKAGSAGGKSSAKKLTKIQRQERARKGGLAKAAKRKK